MAKNRIYLWLNRGLGNFRSKVAEINLKYATPRVQMTPLVKASLLFLRLYLILLVGILVYKFITMLQ
jgi:hypothetical protein